MAPQSRVKKPCKHTELDRYCSEHFGYTDYKPRSVPELHEAARPAGGRTEKFWGGTRNEHTWDFPAPLILPGDDLEYDPDWPEQSLRDWQAEPARNEVSRRRRTIYLCAPPRVTDEVAFIRKWDTPHVFGERVDSKTRHPDVSDVADYLAAFYHGLPVKILNEDLRFTAWDEMPKKRRKTPASAARQQPGPGLPEFIGLASSKECTRIRVRETRDGAFLAQLNLNDVLDVAISVLPSDAYALLMMVDQDIYEGDDDDFCCGRAYGGSRIAVVSSSRYNPAFDEIEGVDRAHAWPASHCLAYMRSRCEEADCEHLHPPKPTKVQMKKKAKVSKKASLAPPPVYWNAQPSTSPLHSAVAAHDALRVPISRKNPDALAGLWLGHVCKTASHELGHCFGMDHCVYYACIMQGTASLAEDARQPPYLCPVDMSKVMRATGSELDAHYAAMLAFCERKAEVRLFAALGAWLRARREALVESGGQSEAVGQLSTPSKPEIIEISD